MPEKDSDCLDEAPSIVVLVLDQSPELAAQVNADLATLYPGLNVTALGAQNLKVAAQSLGSVVRDGVLLPVVIMGTPESTNAGLHQPVDLSSFRSLPGAGASRVILVSGSVERSFLSEALATGLIDSYLSRPYSPAAFGAEVKKNLSAYLLEHHPDLVSRKPALVTHFALSTALKEALNARQRLHGQIQGIRSAAFLKPPSSQDAAGRLAERAEQWLIRHGKSNQIESHGPSTVILAEHAPNDTVWFVLEGAVVQEKASQRGTVTLMNQGAGEIVGVLSLISRSPAFSTIRSVGEVRLARLNRQDLADLLSEENEGLAEFLHVVLKLLHNRIVTVSETKVQLQDSLDELRAVQVKLVESEKMATIGLLTAGVAHELNNPAAALSRAAEHLGSLFESVFAALVGNQDPSTDSLKSSLQMFHAGLRPPPSTAEIRERAASISLSMGLGHSASKQLAEMQIAAGDVFSDHWAGLGAESVSELYRYLEMGKYLANIRSSSARIASLVQGMRNYAKADSSGFVQVDIRDGIGDTAMVLGNRLKAYDFETDYSHLTQPRIMALSSRLNQVWTNLLANACDATPPGGKIRVCVSNEVVQRGVHSSGRDVVRVRVTDTGCGIPISLAPRIFEPRFTTKTGMSEHTGLGLGLMIVKKIVDEHGGEIRFVSPLSSTGGTEFTVDLPPSGPGLEGSDQRKNH
jgi:signal transduction histidine kinase